MKKRHTWKSPNLFPKKEKDALAIIKDPAKFARVMELAKAASRAAEIKKQIEDNQFDSLTEWGVWTLTHMSPSLAEKTKEFREKFLELIESYDSKENNSDEQREL